MAFKSNIESGVQFLARLHNRPGLQNFFNELFPNGLTNRETVELCGNLSSGKTLLLTQLIAKCIMPMNYNDKTIGGLDVNVVFINTDHHFKMQRLRDFLLNNLKQNDICTGTNSTLIDGIIKLAFDNLIIINCYSKAQFFVTLETLNLVIMKSENIGLVAIDSIASYYWENRESGGEWSFDKYVKSILGRVQKHTIPSKIPFIYTKSIKNDLMVKSNDAFNCAREPTLELINYRVKLIKTYDEKNCTCTVESYEINNERAYTIGVNGIEFSERKKRKIDE